MFNILSQSFLSFKNYFPQIHMKNYIKSIKKYMIEGMDYHPHQKKQEQPS